MQTSRWRRSSEQVEDSLSDGGHAGLWRRAAVAFFSTRSFETTGLKKDRLPFDIEIVFPAAKAGIPRKYHIAEHPPVSAEAALADSKWQRISWRRGTKGRLTCLFAARRIRIADGHKHRMHDQRMQRMPGEEVWLAGERRSTGEQKYYVSNLPADLSLKKLAATMARQSG